MMMRERGAPAVIVGVVMGVLLVLGLWLLLVRPRREAQQQDRRVELKAKELRERKVAPPAGASMPVPGR